MQDVFLYIIHNMNVLVYVVCLQILLTQNHTRSTIIRLFIIKKTKIIIRFIIYSFRGLRLRAPSAGGSLFGRLLEPAFVRSV